MDCKTTPDDVLVALAVLREKGCLEVWVHLGWVGGAGGYEPVGLGACWQHNPSPADPFLRPVWDFLVQLVLESETIPRYPVDEDWDISAWICLEPEPVAFIRNYLDAEDRCYQLVAQGPLNRLAIAIRAGCLVKGTVPYEHSPHYQP